MMPDAEVVWRALYGDRQTLFVDGVALGDYFAVPSNEGRVWKARLWARFRLNCLWGGREQLVLTEEAARTVLLKMVSEQRAAEA